MSVKKVNIAFKFFIICLFTLCLISAVSASEDTNSTKFDNGTHYIVTPDLSNTDIQSIIDNADNYDTIEFNSSEYDSISIVIDKPLKIVSGKNSTINVATSLSDKAVSLGINNTFGFYFTKSSSGSILSGFNIIASSADYAIIVDASSNTLIENNTVSQANNNILVKNADNVQIINNYVHNAILNSIQVQDVKNIKIARKYVIADNHKLETMIYKFNIEVDKRHRATDDSIATGELFLKLLDIAKES